MGLTVTPGDHVTPSAFNSGEMFGLDAAYVKLLAGNLIEKTNKSVRVTSAARRIRDHRLQLDEHLNLVRMLKRTATYLYVFGRFVHRRRIRHVGDGIQPLVYDLRHFIYSWGVFGNFL